MAAPPSCSHRVAALQPRRSPRHPAMPTLPHADAQPNAGDFSEGGLAARMKAAAADWVHMTVVGVGLDFNRCAA